MDAPPPPPDEWNSDDDDAAPPPPGDDGGSGGEGDEEEKGSPPPPPQSKRVDDSVVGISLSGAMEDAPTDATAWEERQGSGLQGLDPVLQGNEEDESEFLDAVRGRSEWDTVMGAEDAQELQENEDVRRRLKTAERERLRLDRAMVEAAAERDRVQGEKNKIQGDLDATRAEVEAERQRLAEHEAAAAAALAAAERERAEIVAGKDTELSERAAALEQKGLEIDELRQRAADTKAELEAAAEAAEERVRAREADLAALNAEKEEADATLARTSAELTRVKYPPGRVCVTDHNGDRLCNASSCAVM